MAYDYANIHPELQSIAKSAPAITFSSKNIWLINRLARLTSTPKTPGDMRVENIKIPRQAGQPKLRLRSYRPRSVQPPTPALIWFHGGGYVLGRPEQDEVSCLSLARAAGIRIFSVDYRLAPKHPFPAGLEDGYTALRWVDAQAEPLGIDAGRIALGGASAGGGLAAGLAQFAHDRQEIKLAFQLLVYPMLDDRTALREDLDDRSNITWNQASNRFGWESYLGQKCGGNEAPEYAAPGRREDLSGLPPAWIGVGTVDHFYDEDLAYGNRLQASGVECEVKLVPGAFHGFDVFEQVPLVQEFHNAQVAALKKGLFG